MTWELTDRGRPICPQAIGEGKRDDRQQDCFEDSHVGGESVYQVGSLNTVGFRSERIK